MKSKFALQIANHLTPLFMGEYVAWKFTRPFRYKRPQWEKELASSAVAATLPSGRKIWTWGLEGPVVLLVHGWEGRGTQLGAFVAPLLEKGFRVVAWDGPAHGESPGASTHLLHFSEALAEDIRHLAHEIHGVVAHSMGGSASLLAMRAGHLVPKRITLIASPARFTPVIDGVVSRHKLTALTKLFLKKSLERRIRRPIEDLDLKVGEWRPQVPVQILHDENDKDVPLIEAHRLALVLMPQDFKTFRGLGHRKILKSQDVLDRVAEFLVREEVVENEKAVVHR
jgi:pimeloyl-ACP methyl ester carboxylesterase